MHVSSAAKPVNQPDALRLLLDRVSRGADATLIAEGDAAGVLLDLAADCLSGRRTRVIRAAEVLPSRPGAPMPSAHGAGKAGPPGDESFSRSFQALTVLDPPFDRIVLLVGDAHALQQSALRCIQFASRSAAHLQLVFCGTRAFFDLLNIEEFTWLRARLRAGLVLTLAAPIPEDWDAPPPSVSDEQAAWAAEAAAPFPGAGRPAVSASRASWPLRLGALALLGLGGAASLMLGMPGGGSGKPAASQQAAFLVQPQTPPDAPAPAMPSTGAASQAAPAAAPAKPDAVSPGSPPSAPVTPPSAGSPGSLVTVRSKPRASLPENEPRAPAPPPGLARNSGRPSAPAASSRAAAALDNRIRRLREARDQAAPPPSSDHWSEPYPTIDAWTPPASQPPRYIGSYTTDANGVRMFRLEP